MAQQTGTTSESSLPDVILIAVCPCALYFGIEGKRVASMLVMRSHICSPQLPKVTDCQNFWFDRSKNIRIKKVYYGYL